MDIGDAVIAAAGAVLMKLVDYLRTDRVKDSEDKTLFHDQIREMRKQIENLMSQINDLHIQDSRKTEQIAALTVDVLECRHDREQLHEELERLKNG